MRGAPSSAHQCGPVRVEEVFEGCGLAPRQRLERIVHPVGVSGAHVGIDRCAEPRERFGNARGYQGVGQGFVGEGEELDRLASHFRHQHPSRPDEGA